MVTLADYIKKMSSLKKIIKVTDIMDTKRYALSMYHRYLIELYDKNFISDPTFLDMKEVYTCIADYEIQGLEDVLGLTDISYHAVSLAKTYHEVKTPDDEDVIEYLTLLQKAVFYREISANLDKLYNEGVVRSGGKKRLNLHMIQDGVRMELSNPYRFDEGIIWCMRGIGAFAERVTINKHLVNVTKDILGIETADFVSGFSEQQIEDHIVLLLQGRVPLDGKDGKKLSDRIAEIRNAGFMTENLYTWIVENQPERIIEGIEYNLNNTEDVVYGYGTDLFVIPQTKRRTSEIEYPIGHFVYCQYDVQTGVSMAYQWYFNCRFDSVDLEAMLPEKNGVLGYSGQVYSKDYLENNSIEYVGSPIRLYNTEGVIEEFIDFEQTELVNNKTMFKEYDAILEFDNSRFDRKPMKKYTAWQKQIVSLFTHKNSGKFSTTISIPNSGFEISELMRLADKIEADLEIADYK